jgi:hypothetical protein
VPGGGTLPNVPQTKIPNKNLGLAELGKAVNIHLCYLTTLII